MCLMTGSVCHSDAQRYQWFSRISVQDYAVAMLDELESPKHSLRRFTVGY